jgi:hypothetical protein
MLVVLLDEPGLFVHESHNEAIRDIEPLDVESTVRAAFDEHAVPYVVEWLRPNRGRRLLGLVSVLMPGQYRFRAAGPPDHHALARLIDQHSEYATPPEAREGLLELRRQLAV